MIPEFPRFPKIARLSREVIITEKIDGTNASIYINEDGLILVGSRTRWITPQNDNAGFAAWVKYNADELRQLGPGHHFGEWWGRGIQRGYGLDERRFSLFNTSRWCLHGETPKEFPTLDPRITRKQDALPACCRLVPELYRGDFCTWEVNLAMDYLKTNGSRAAPGYCKPEGVVIYHTAGAVGFKKTIEKDGQWKGKA